MPVQMPVTSVPPSVMGEAIENSQDNAVKIQSLGKVSIVGVERCLFSSTSILEPLSYRAVYLDRLVAINKRVSSYFFRKCMQDSQPENMQCILQLMVKNGMAFKSHDQESFIKTAVSKNDIEIVKALLTLEADEGESLDDSDNFVCVRTAVKRGYLEALKLLVKHGVALNGGSFWNCGDLIKDALNSGKNRAEMIQFLLEQNIVSYESGSPDDGPVTQKDIQNVRRDAFRDALEAKCDVPTLCLMLVECRPDSVDELDKEECIRVYESGFDLEWSNAGEGCNASLNLKEMLKNVVNEAHEKAKDDRWMLQF